MQQQNFDIVAIMEMWWDDSHNRSAAMGGYKLFRRDKEGRRVGRVALYVMECFDCLELDDGHDRIKCLWVRIRGKANKADIMVGVCYRPPNQGLAVYFNKPGVSWKYNTAERKQSRRFLGCGEDNFLTQLVSEPTREGAPLDLLFANRKGLISDVSVGGRLRQSYHKMVEFPILREVRRGVSRTATLVFRRADLACLGAWLTESLGRQS